MRRAILMVCCATLISTAANAADPTGDWRVEDGSAIIRIDNCNGALWGIVAWEKSPGRDTQNPNASLRGRPTLGVPIVINMKPTSQGRWDGQVYNAQNGKTYDANVRMVGEDRLRIQGCVLGGVFCGGQQWTRVENETVGRGAGRGRSDVCSRISNLSGRSH
jgi:uncharacterized protein (DUF2147 family)